MTVAQAKARLLGWTNQQIFDRARAAGCLPAVAELPNGRFHMTCGCGYTTLTTRATKTEAVRQVMSHLTIVSAALSPGRVNGGVSLPTVTKVG